MSVSSSPAALPSGWFLPCDRLCRHFSRGACASSFLNLIWLRAQTTEATRPRSWFSRLQRKARFHFRRNHRNWVDHVFEAKNKTRITIRRETFGLFLLFI